MRRQFCEMARMLGWSTEEGEVDVTGFAMAVEGWTQSGRRACLERFYGMVEETKGVARSIEGGAEGSDDDDDEL